VSPAVLLKREGFTAICEDISELNPEAMYIDPNTQKQTKCKDADNFCATHDCGSQAEVREFFRNTDCCTNPEPVAPGKPRVYRLQRKTEQKTE